MNNYLVAQYFVILKDVILHLILMNSSLYSYTSPQGLPAPHPHFLHTGDACFLSVIPNQGTSAFWATPGLHFYCCSLVTLKGRDKTCNQPAHQLEGKCWFSIPTRLHLKSWLHLVATYSLYPKSEFGRRSNLLIYNENKSYKNRARQNARKKREEEDAKIICNSTAHTTRRKNDKCLSPHR